MSNTVRVLLITSALAILGGTVLAIMSAFSPGGLFTGVTLILIGAVGLFAGMRAIPSS